MTEKTTAMMTPGETAAWLYERDGFLIVAHRRPDGDAIGCAGALAQGLRELGKTAYILHDSDTTKRYLSLAKDYWAPEGYRPNHVITVDTASADMLPDSAAEYISAVSLCIDHHASNTFYAQYTCLDPGRAACGEVLYDILKALPCGVSARSAEGLYVALSTDTGCFSFANTTANTLRTAAMLIDLGAPHTKLNRRLFRTKSRGRVKLEGLINEAIEFYCNDKAAIAYVTRAMLEVSGATEDDLDDIASIPGSIFGVLAGITIRELSSKQDCKVSVRTAPSVSAHGICQRFGGGGHPMAAGFIRAATVEQVKEDLVRVLDEFIPADA